MATPATGTGGVFSAGSNRAFKSQLKRVYTWYTGGFVVFVIALAIAEQMGLPETGSAMSSCSPRWACTPASA